MIICADGLEECEALIVRDLLYRAKIACDLVALRNPTVISAHNLTFATDKVLTEVKGKDYAAIILPGGMPGTKYLTESKLLKDLLTEFQREHKLIAAICAAPSLLIKLGFVGDHEFTVFPGFAQGKIPAEKAVVVHDNIITANGLCAAFRFAQAIITYLTTKRNADNVLKSILYL